MAIFPVTFPRWSSISLWLSFCCCAGCHRHSISYPWRRHSSSPLFHYALDITDCTFKRRSWFGKRQITYLPEWCPSSTPSNGIVRYEDFNSHHHLTLTHQWHGDPRQIPKLRCRVAEAYQPKRWGYDWTHLKADQRKRCVWGTMDGMTKTNMMGTVIDEHQLRCQTLREKRFGHANFSQNGNRPLWVRPGFPCDILESIFISATTT